MPRVTVITPIYNGERFVAQTIASLLKQSLTDFEYVLIDDGSTDASYTVAQGFAAQDARIRLIRHSSNLGISRTLNHALSLARSDLVAILDHDDLAMPDRLTVQADYLDAHPAAVLVGSQVELLDEEGTPTAIRELPTHAGVIRWDLLFRCSVQHSACMMRRAQVEAVGGYAPNQRYAVEYDLFWRLAQEGEIVNLPQVLAAQRIGPGQTSSRQADVQQREVALWQWALYRGWLGMQIGPDLVQALYAANRDQPLADADQLLAAADLLETLHAAYLTRVQPDSETRALIAAEVGWKLLVYATSRTPLTPDQAAELQARAVGHDALLMSRKRVQARVAAP